MKDKRPQPTAVLVKRLRRVAKWIDGLIELGTFDAREDTKAGLQARANVCWQAAARLEDLSQSSATADDVALEAR